MRSYKKLVAASTFLSIFAIAAHADCAADLAKLQENSGIPTASETNTTSVTNNLNTGETSPSSVDVESKNNGDILGEAREGTDSTLTASDIDAASGNDNSEASETEASGIAKDGTLAPLEKKPSENSNQAMSEQDAQAQQKDAPTAAEKAEADGSDTRESLLQQAEAALADGDEATCQDAVAKAAAL